MRGLFFGPNGLRAGWGLALFVALFTAISTALLLAANAVYRPRPGMDPVDFLVSDGLSFLAAVAAAALMAKIENRSRAEYGLRLSRGCASRFGAGLVWGFLPVATTMAVLALCGGVSIAGFALSGKALAASAAVWAASMVVLGFFEEYLFRGYPLVALARGMGFWPAAILLSALFGALHYFTKPMESLLDAFSVALIGFFLCFTIARTGDLWLAAGFHAAFDFFALGVAGAANTGNGGKPVPGHLLATAFHGPAWLTGGVCGIEASIVMVAAMALLFPLFGRVFRRVPGPRGSRAPAEVLA
jgi:membrane protease YdiL (CAAX protease family)